jgi:hypothetical protein
VVPRGAVERHFPQDHAKYRATEQLRGSDGGDHVTR